VQGLRRFCEDGTVSLSQRLTACRVCAGATLHPILDLGATALANRFLAAEQLDEPEPLVPLRLVLCADCGLVQIDETVDPATLFSHYLYVTGTSDLARQHAADLADKWCDRFALEAGEQVVELASNDGTVLQAFQRQRLRVLGVEPAQNIAATANAAGVPTVSRFFNAAAARELRAEHGPARLLIARHVLAHVADLGGFIQGIEHWLADNGVAVIEVPHLLPFYTNLEYDTIYHEHLCYFSVRVLATLADKYGLELVDVEPTNMHGGSILVTMQRRGGPGFISTSVDDFLVQELAAGLHLPQVWKSFAKRVETNRVALRTQLDKLWDSGLTVAGYGAAAKGMTLLAASSLDRAHLPYIVDKNPLKQGLYTPGHRIPVCAPEQLRACPPDVLLILAWNFAPEIIRQQAAFAERGGKFLLPLPSPHFAGERRAKRVA
jgi:novobiocin biosynthesis protein NovU/D-mycarose 3-C-methyltransferase